MNVPHSEGGFINLADTLYAFGGKIPNGGHVTKTEYFDEATQTWKYGVSSSLDCPGTWYWGRRCFVMGVVQYSKFEAYLLGGKNPNSGLCTSLNVRVTINAGNLLNCNIQVIC